MRTITSIVLRSSVVCSSSGSAMFPPTDSEPIRAPPWKARPMRLRMASNSRARAVEMSTPLIRTSPEDGFSRPTRVRSMVLLPEPEPPITTSVSPRRTSNVRPCRTSRSPKRTRRSRAEMMGSWESDAAIRSSFLPAPDRTGL